MVFGGFSNPQLEGQFQHEAARTLAQQDARNSLVLALVWVGSVTLHNSRVVPTTAALFFLLPWALFTFQRQLYVSQRREWVTVLRLVALLLPVAAGQPGGGPEDQQWRLGPSNIATLGMLAGLPLALTLALAFRLDLKMHLSLQGLLATRLALVQAPRECQSGLLMSPGAQAWFGAFVERVNGILMLFPAHVNPLPGSGGTEISAQAHCYAVIVYLHLLLGFFLPTVLVYLAEQQARAKFAASLAEQLQEEDRQLDLPDFERMRVLMFDRFGAGAKAVALLPLVGLLLWCVAMLLAMWLYPSY